nr:MAG TPA: hypothetical protein [Crassvirales sp.]
MIKTVFVLSFESFLDRAVFFLSKSSFSCHFL